MSKRNVYSGESTSKSKKNVLGVSFRDRKRKKQKEEEHLSDKSKGNSTPTPVMGKKFVQVANERLDKIEKYLADRWNWLLKPLPSKDLLNKRYEREI